MHREQETGERKDGRCEECTGPEQHLAVELRVPLSRLAPKNANEGGVFDLACEESRLLDRRRGARSGERGGPEERLRAPEPWYGEPPLPRGVALRLAVTHAQGNVPHARGDRR